MNKNVSAGIKNESKPTSGAYGKLIN